MPPPTLLLETLLSRMLLNDCDSSVMPVESELLASLPSIRLPVDFLSEMPPLLPLTSLPRMRLSLPW